MQQYGCWSGRLAASAWSGLLDQQSDGGGYGLCYFLLNGTVWAAGGGLPFVLCMCVCVREILFFGEKKRTISFQPLLNISRWWFSKNECVFCVPSCGDDDRYGNFQKGGTIFSGRFCACADGYIIERRAVGVLKEWGGRWLTLVLGIWCCRAVLVLA